MAMPCLGMYKYVYVLLPAIPVTGAGAPQMVHALSFGGEWSP